MQFGEAPKKEGGGGARARARARALLDPYLCTQEVMEELAVGSDARPPPASQGGQEASEPEHPCESPTWHQAHSCTDTGWGPVPPWPVPSARWLPALGVVEEDGWSHR